MAFNAYGGPDEERRRPNPMTFGTPMQPKPADSAGAAVRPQMGAEGSANPQSATPSFSKGGAIPDDDNDTMEPDDDNDDPENPVDALASGAGVRDDTTSNISDALKLVNQAMMYGRKKSGLPVQQKQQEPAPQDDSGIPDDDSGDGESYAEGGAIEDDDIVAAHEQAFPDQERGQDDSGAAPVADGGFAPDPQSGDNSGAAPVAPQQVIGYLQGADSLPPEVVKQAEDQVHGNPAEKAVGAVAKLSQEKGPDAGFGAVQYNRSAYNAKAGFAYMALNGTPQKPPDLAAATKAATQATPHLLDGNLLTFAPADGGVTANAGGETLKLTVPQFNQFLDIRKSGQYDQIFEKGGGLIALKEIMKGPGEPPGNMQTGTATIGQPAPAGAQAGGSAPTNRTGPVISGRIPESGSYDDNMGYHARTPAHNGSFQQDRPDNTSAPVQIHSGGGSKTFINGVDQTENEQQEKALERIRAKNEGRDTSADRMARAQLTESGKNQRAEASQNIRDKYNTQRIASELQRIASTAQNASRGVRGRMIDSAIQSAGGIDRVPPEIKKMAMDVLNGTGQQQAAPQQQQSGGSGGAPVTVQSPADAQKLAPGTVYMTPDGRKFTR